MLPKSKDMRLFNQLLAVLGIDEEEKVINVSERGNVDGNFIISHLLKQIVQEGDKCCLILFHNDLDHYQTIAKKLGYDISMNIKDNNIEVIDALTSTIENIDVNTFCPKTVVEKLCFDIVEVTERLSSFKSNRIYIVMDDVSHLLDIRVGLKEVLSFLNFCVNLVSDKVRLIVNSHVSCKQDKILSNYLSYVSDVNIEVSPLCTGKSVDVSGLLTIERLHNFVLKRTLHHFKIFDRGIRVFSPGESIYNLYK